MSAGTQGNWRSAANLRLKVDAVYRTASEVEVTDTAGDFDATNLESPIDADTGLVQEEHDHDTINYVITCNILIPRTAQSALKTGKFYPCILEERVGEVQTGTASIMNRKRKGAVKGAYAYSLTLKYSGAVVSTANPPTGP